MTHPMTSPIDPEERGIMASRDYDLNANAATAEEPLPPVFVFGSNLAGRHGKGAALWARQHRGALYGQPAGAQGNSYAIPTKDANLRTLPVRTISVYVGGFLAYARNRPATRFQLTPIGCGLAGYSYGEIAPLFRDAPPNVIIPPEFAAVLADGGT